MASSRETLKQLFGKRTAGIVARPQYLLVIDSLGVMAAFGLSQLILDESFEAMAALVVSHWPLLLVSIFVRIGLNKVFCLYDRLWRYASISEAVQILKSSCLAAGLMVLVNVQLFPWLGLPSVESASFFLLEYLFVLSFTSGSRFCLRYETQWLATHNKFVSGNLSPRVRVLLVGAEDSVSLIRIMLENPELGYIPSGIIDEDPEKQSLRVCGIPVIGKSKDLPRLVRAHKIDEVIVNTPGIDSPGIHSDTINKIRRLCAQAPVQMRIAPDMRAFVSGHITINHLRQWRSSMLGTTVKPTKLEYHFQNILVPGGAGFIGSNFVRYMLEDHPEHRIVVYDKLTYAGNLDNLQGLSQTYRDRYVFIQGDICDADHLRSVMENYRIDAIVNFAAETHVDRSLVTPEDFLHTNIWGTFQLLEAARQRNIGRFHQISTDEVYGQVLQGSFSEDDPVETRSPYSFSKASADLLAYSYFNSFGIPVTITRCSNNIGPYQYPEKAVPLFITNALENKPLPIYGDGRYVRDYIYVLDHCRGIDIVLHKGTPGEIYNLGSGAEVEAITLAKMILAQLEKPYSLIQYVSDRNGQDRRYSLNCAKIKALGWAPQWNFDHALASTIQWYLNNEWWWQKMKSGEYSAYYERQYRQRLNESVRSPLNE